MIEAGDIIISKNSQEPQINGIIIDATSRTIYQKLQFHPTAFLLQSLAGTPLCTELKQIPRRAFEGLLYLAQLFLPKWVFLKSPLSDFLSPPGWAPSPLSSKQAEFFSDLPLVSRFCPVFIGLPALLSIKNVHV